MNMRIVARIAPFLIGVLIGVLGAVYLPAYVRPLLPEWIAGPMTVVKGTVAAKQKKEQSLLLTVDTPDGVLLATFTRRVDEINLLVNETDVVELALSVYKPFIENPRIMRVIKKTPAGLETAPVTTSTTSTATGTGDAGKKGPEKSAPAASLPKTDATGTVKESK
jgi:hypothetical protein